MLTTAAVIALQLVSPITIWRNYDEVFDFAVVHGQMEAATNGGLIRYDGVKWVPVQSPSCLRSIDSVDPLVVGCANGRQFGWNGSSWNARTAAVRLRSGETGLQLAPTDQWLHGAPELLAKFPIPPANHAYTVIRSGHELLAGTSIGIYRFTEGKWNREALPSDVPTSRVNGCSQVNGTFVLGGINGLFVGKPGRWSSVCDDSIRQVKRLGDDIWVVHGNGALDKLNVAENHLYPDVMTGASRRPWTACIGSADQVPLLAGMGGWTESSAAWHEVFPSLLQQDVITAIVGIGSTRWVGTEKTGLIRFRPGNIRVWNPGNGLADTWVTSLCRTKQGVVVGTLHSGLFLMNGDTVSPMASPSQRITQLALFKGNLVLGAMDGAWIQRNGKWDVLDTGREETTSILALNGLVVTTAQGVYFF